MFGNGYLATLACLSFICIGITFGADCWSSKACMDVGTCNTKGGYSQKGLCTGTNNIQCCSCSTCMDAATCTAKGGVPHSGICAGTANIQCCNMGSTSVPTGARKPSNEMLTDLADILRNAGLTVIEVEGWKTRGHGVMSSVKGILAHHTAGAPTGDYPSLRIVRDGRPDLEGPLSQLGLGRSGTWYVIAAGRSYHAGKTIDDSIFGNSNAIGIEAEGTGVPSTNVGHAAWPEEQYQSYIRGVKALQAAYGIPTAHILAARVLEKAHSSTKAKGSSTACIIALTDQGLHAINLGDSGFIVVRDGCTIFRSPVQQHDFNFTFQLESGNSGDLPSSGQVFTIPVAPGDVVIAGTDGLFDNLYNNEVNAVVVHAVRTGLGPQVTAQKIAALARQRALDKNRQTPFSTAAQDAGFRYYGGKLDDITVVVSYITDTSNESSSHSACESG